MEAFLVAWPKLPISGFSVVFVCIVDDEHVRQIAVVLKLGVNRLHVLVKILVCFAKTVEVTVDFVPHMLTDMIRFVFAEIMFNLVNGAVSSFCGRMVRISFSVLSGHSKYPWAKGRSLGKSLEDASDINEASSLKYMQKAILVKHSEALDVRGLQPS
jgi:hypothetical protein